MTEAVNGCDKKEGQVTHSKTLYRPTVRARWAVQCTTQTSMRSCSGRFGPCRRYRRASIGKWPCVWMQWARNMAKDVDHGAIRGRMIRHGFVVALVF